MAREARLVALARLRSTNTAGPYRVFFETPVPGKLPPVGIIIFLEMWKRRGSASLSASDCFGIWVLGALAAGCATCASLCFLVLERSSSGLETWMMGLASREILAGASAGDWGTACLR